jgi:hypothetical protein
MFVGAAMSSVWSARRRLVFIGVGSMRGVCGAFIVAVVRWKVGKGGVVLRAGSMFAGVERTSVERGWG